MVNRLAQRGIHDEVVLETMRRVPRHAFIEEKSGLLYHAYDDSALPIGCNQTISQPYIVAFMTQILVMGKPVGKVLEIGTGCGYQTAVLAALAKQVFTVERIWELQNRARTRHRMQGLKNIMYRHGDGHHGWDQEAPFDGILVTAAAAAVPSALKEQLADGGKMVIPVGADAANQELCLVTRDGDDCHVRTLMKVRFVPMQPGLF